MRTALSTQTGFWIFCFHQHNGAHTQLAPAQPAQLIGVSDRTIHLDATFDISPGSYCLVIGVGPNPLETQQVCPIGTLTLRQRQALLVHAHIDVTLPNPTPMLI